MTQLLEQAIERIRELPDDRQEVVAQLILDEVDAARAWDERFAASADQLEVLARRAMDEDDRGLTVEKGWDEL